MYIYLNQFAVYLKVTHFKSTVFYTWRRQWHPTPVLLPGKSHGQRRLVGCHLWGHTESDTEKEPISKVKRQSSEWEKIITNETTDKGLISKYTSSSYNSVPEKQTTQSKSGENT